MQKDTSRPPLCSGGEIASRTEQEDLRGWIPGLATSDQVRAALEKAFDYRGDVTLTLKNGERIEGFIFDRRSAQTFEECSLRLLPKDRQEKRNIPYSHVARLEFSDRDPAAGKSFEAWIKKYRARKALGEQGISLQPEALD